MATGCSESRVTAPRAVASADDAPGVLASVDPATNGDGYVGQITLAGEIDTLTFSATKGDYVALGIGRVSGTANFTPWIRLVSPTGAVVASDYGTSAAQTAARVPLTGTYRILVGSNDSGNNDTGTYRLTFVKAPGAAVVPSGDQGGTLVNGADTSGSITLGDLDVWQFNATRGDALVVSMGEVTGSASFSPWLRLIAPDGTVVSSNYGTAAAQVAASAPYTGTYTVVVGTYNGYYDGTGSYRLTLANGPGAVTVAASDQGGALKNGAANTGTLLVGDLDVWQFSANRGDAIAVGMGKVTGSASFSPWLRLVAPNGTVVASNYGAAAAQVSASAPATGTYTVVVGTYNGYYDGSGDYSLSLAKGPGTVTISSGDEGGAIKNGASRTGTITIGDLDTWQFTAKRGDAIAVAMGEVTGSASFSPWLRLVAPDGTVISSDYGTAAAQVSASAPAAGTYTVIVGTYNGYYDGTGNYSLNLAQGPGTISLTSGDQGGGLPNGALKTGSITIGDLDPWQFTASRGDAIVVKMGEVTGSPNFYPWLRLVAPDGTILDSDYGAAAAQVSASAPATGTYTVIVGTYNGYYDGTGDYRLTLARAPGTSTVVSGDQGGTIPNGATRAGTITEGDLDVWQFSAAQGDAIALSMSEVSGTPNFYPWLYLVGPDGTVLGSNYGAAAAQLNQTAPTGGTYTVIAGTYNGYYDGTGDYTLSLSALSLARQRALVAHAGSVPADSTAPPTPPAAPSQ